MRGWKNQFRHFLKSLPELAHIPLTGALLARPVSRIEWLYHCSEPPTKHVKKCWGSYLTLAYRC